VDGWVWGRGALDMKGGVAMMVSAFLRASNDAAQLPGDVVLTVLVDEEAGGDHGAKFLVEEHAHLFDGIEYAIGEFGGFNVEIGGRALPGFGPADLIAEVKEVVGDDIELELVRHDAAAAEPRLDRFDALAGILRELDPGAAAVPMVQAGVTDARFFARLGIQTYGFLPLRLPADFRFTGLIHAADERVPADAIEFGAEAVFRALQ